MICSFSESSARPDSFSSLRKASSCPSSSCLLWECSPRPPVSTACAGAAGCEAVNLPSDAKEAALSPAPTTDPSPTPRVTSVRPSCMRRAARPAKAPPTMPTTTPAPAPLATEPTKARKGFARAASIAACGKLVTTLCYIMLSSRCWPVRYARLVLAATTAETQAAPGRLARTCRPVSFHLRVPSRFRAIVRNSSFDILSLYLRPPPAHTVPLKPSRDAQK